MLMDQKLLDLFQEQINKEFNSAYKYLGMAAYFQTTPFHGFATWMRHQTQEELEHGMKLFDYVHSRGHCVELLPIASTPTQYASAFEVFNGALAHEQFITRSINEMYRVALEAKDYAAQILLQWYIKEQVEEEKQVQEIIDQFEFAGDNMGNIIAIDHEAGKRRN
ncbi:MAG: ferritin [Puniceicoccales bacterium]|jgi:ferritin|nr:ferritin [Puniceicoccales bacterium]